MRCTVRRGLRASFIGAERSNNGFVPGPRCCRLASPAAPEPMLMLMPMPMLMLTMKNGNCLATAWQLRWATRHQHRKLKCTCILYHTILH